MDLCVLMQQYVMKHKIMNFFLEQTIDLTKLREEEGIDVAGQEKGDPLCISQQGLL